MNSLVIQPTSFQELQTYAQLIASSSFCPNAMKGKAGDVLIAIQMGGEVGLSPIQALQNIAVINGKPSIYGDAAMALVQAHPACEDVVEDFCEDTMTATCTVTRKGQKPHTSVFSQKDAEKAKLWGKAGPWTQYTKRMLQMRARGFALRDKFPDALKGLITQEEAQDYPTTVTFSDKPPIKEPQPLSADEETFSLTEGQVKKAEEEQEPIEEDNELIPEIEIIGDKKQPIATKYVEGKDLDTFKDWLKRDGLTQKWTKEQLKKIDIEGIDFIPYQSADSILNRLLRAWQKKGQVK